MFDVPSNVVLDRSSWNVILVFSDINVLSWSAGIFDSPFVGHESEALGIFYHHLCNLGVLRVLGVWAFEEHSKGEKGGLDGLDGRPVGAEGVKADGALKVELVS
jgi:hypothetical protein